MACPVESILTNLAKSLEDKTIKEFKYFRDFENHVQDFVIEHNSLVAKRKKVEKDIEDGKKRNENQIEDDVQNWIEEADIVIQEHTKIKQTWSYGWCPYWQYRQGKMLAKRAPAIRNLIEKCNFERVARPTELPGIKYHASGDFIDFESRKTKLNQLVEALKDGKHYMIGLQGMGGTGKTTLATQVGKQLEESKAFEKVILVVVSNPPDVNKIRGEIARPLGLDLEEKDQAEHSQHLWTRISKNKRKLLIILDDVWEELNLTEIGIPSGLDHKNCYVLITTRHSRVCQAMRCQQIVHLHILDDKDALPLFVFHFGSNDSNGLARDFVKECGGLPVAIVALAKALRNWPKDEWNVRLTTLRDSKRLVDVDEDLVTVYTCLKLSYDHLNDKAQKLFLLCSIFPEDYEIPTSLITRLGIGSGIFGEVDGYYAAKLQALSVKNKLIDCSLLLKVEKTECVKMHDLVHEVAQWIAKEDIQTIMDRRTTLKENKRFVFWNVDGFPNQFDGAKLEILVLFISENFPVKDIEAFFVGMTRLKVLLLRCRYGRKFRIPLWSLLSLNNIHTLILDDWDLGDISSLKNLQSLVTLELKNCLIIELPKDIMELKKLRWLGLRECEIQRNNPFEVIKRCLQLEELYFIGNYNVDNWKPEDDKETGDKIVHDISPSALQMFSIAYRGFECFANDDNGLSNCFNPQHMEHLISEAMFKYFMLRAQVLVFGEIGQTRWQCLVPDIIPVEDGGMDNLMRLYLYERADIECLIDNSKYRYSNMTVFSKLVELHLYGVGVKELYWGAIPSGFLKQLEILKLENCVKLQRFFLDENLQLPHLQVVELIDCPMLQPSIFQPSTAYESSQEELDSQNNYGIFLPELKRLQIEGCDKLEMVWPLILSKDLPKLKDLHIRYCAELKYIVGEYSDVGQVLQEEVMLPFLTKVLLEEVPSFISIFQKCKKFMPRPPQGLKEDSKAKHECSKTSAFSWAYGCCFLAPSKDTNVRFSNAPPEHRIISQESCVPSSKRIETFHIREVTLVGCSKLKSLFSVSIATTIMLEKLHIEKCEELKDIITNETEDDDHLNYTSIFPKLQSLKVVSCDKLEFIFPSTLSEGLQKLKSIQIWGANELKHVFGKYIEEESVSNENENNEPHIHLPALESLSLEYVSNMISIGIKKYQVKCSSLQILQAPKGSSEGMETVHTAKCLMRHPLHLQTIREMTLRGCSKLKSLFSVSIATTMIMLEWLHISGCRKLKDIITNEAEDDDHINSTSIFPKLQSLEVSSCDELEFIFPSTLSRGLQKLNSIDIFEAHKLKYVFGKYNEEEFVSNENENNEPHIHLPALASLSLKNVPNMISIGIMKYQQKCPYLQIMEAPKESHASSSKRIERFHKAECLMRQPLILQNIRQMTLRSCSKLKSLFSVSIATTIMLETLDIMFCEELKDIITNEAEDDDHLNYTSIFPKLQSLKVESCNTLEFIFPSTLHLNCTSIFPKLQRLQVYFCKKLEFIFPSTLSGGLQKLKSIHILGAKELKYVFGRYDDEEFVSNWNENNHLQIHLPALDTLEVHDAPKMINICAKKYYLSFPSLQSITLEDLQEFNERSFLYLMASLQGLQLNVTAPKDWMKIIKDVQKLTSLKVSFLKIEEVLDLEGVEIEGPELILSLEKLSFRNLSELRHIWKGPKYILSLLNLSQLNISACKKLRAIFSISIVKSLPQLSYLEIEDCDELVDIIEESDEDHLRQICFPKLEQIRIKGCNSLKCLFSISTCGMFPNLCELRVEEASKLKQVFIHKQDYMQKTTIEEVFPKLSDITLRELPRLITICEGIDFHHCHVYDCPKYQGIDHIQEGFENGDSENLVATNALPDVVESREEIVVEIEAKDSTPGLKEQASKASTADDPQLRRSPLQNNKETKKEDSRVIPDPASKLLATTSSAFQELEDEHKTIESTTQFQHEDLAETKTTTEASHKINTPLDDYSINFSLKERSEQGPTLEDVAIVDLKPRNSSNVTSSFVSQVGGLQSDPSTLAYKETEKEVGKSIPASSLPATTSPDFEVIVGQSRPEQNLVASMKEKHEQGSQGDDATIKAAIAIQSTDSESMKQTRVSSIIAQSFEETEKEAVRRYASQLPIATTATNLKSAKEKAKGVYEKATATDTSLVATPFQSEFTRELPVKEARDHSSVHKEAESENPIKAVLPQVVPSLHHQSQIADKLGICEIFRLVELKHGETALLAQALEQYPQLLLPREHRTHRIIAWSYRVLVDILVMLATKTPNTITSSEKSTLEANLSEAIVLGFDKGWVESVRAKVFGVDMSNVSKAKEEIQVMEVKLGDIDSQLLVLSEDRKKLIESMTMFGDMISAKDKPFGI